MMRNLWDRILRAPDGGSGAVITATPGGAGVDFMDFRNGEARGHGNIAQRLLSSGFSVNALRTLDVLTKEEWLLYDTAVIAVARQRLVGVADLLGRGLTFNLPNALGTTQVQWDTVSSMTDAELDMSGNTEGENDRVLYSLKTLPIPIIHKSFRLNLRTLETSRRRGESLDVTQASLCARIVAEKVESLLFGGSTMNVGGYTIPGYKTAPNANTGNISDWSSNSTTGTVIVQEILTMIEALQADHMYGPYMLYVPVAVLTRFSDDYKTNSDRTIIERILAIPGILGVRPTENLATSPKCQALLVQMTSDVVDMINGLAPTTVMWEEQAGMLIRFRIITIMVPRMKSDYNTQSGIFYGTVP